jgi:hypothetical protein
VFEPFFKLLLSNNFKVLDDSNAGFQPGIDCLIQTTTGKTFVLTLKCYHRNQNDLKEGSFSEAEAERAKQEHIQIIGVLWNPFWGNYLCKYIDPEKKERISWSITDFGSKEDLEIKNFLLL